MDMEYITERNPSATHNNNDQREVCIVIPSCSLFTPVDVVMIIIPVVELLLLLLGHLIYYHYGTTWFTYRFV